MTGMNTSLITNILGGEHAGTLIKVAAWGIQLLYGVVVLGCFAAFFVNVARLAMSSGNPAARSTAVKGIIISGGCLAVLGGIGIVFVLIIGFMR